MSRRRSSQPATKKRSSGSRRRRAAARDRARDAQFFFDGDAADRACFFFDRFLHHVKGEWAGQRLVLEGWQRDRVVREAFGWKRRADGTRRYRTIYLEIPRKGGKTTLAAGTGLLLTTGDGEPGAEVYSAAGDRDQAAIAFDLAKQMVEMEPALQRRCTVFRRSITVPSTGSFYRVLSAEAYTKHGYNPHGIIFDEVHVQPNRELWDTLVTGTAGRRQPLTVAITTAGYDRKSLCWQLHEYAQRVTDGTIDDPTFLPVIFAADPDDDWTDPKVWAKANPNLGISPKLSYMDEQCRKAEESPAYQNTFRRNHLNQWTEQSTRWIEMDVWDACARAVAELELEGRPCWAGLDLSSTTDISALVYVFVLDGGLLVPLPRFWIPEENAIARSRKDKVPYDAWLRDGYVFGTPGNVIDQDVIRKQINADLERFDIREIAIDRWNASQISVDLQKDGLEVVAFGQGFASMSAPTKELERRLLEKKVAHGGNPVLRWMASNVAVKGDPAGNLKPDKAASYERIDGIVSFIMGIARAVLGGGEETSVYETEGILVL